MLVNVHNVLYTIHVSYKTLQNITKHYKTRRTQEMKKVKELTNEELLNRYFYYRTKYDDLDYSEEYIKHVEKQFERAEEEVLRRMGGFKK